LENIEYMTDGDRVSFDSSSFIPAAPERGDTRSDSCCGRAVCRSDKAEAEANGKDGIEAGFEGSN